MEEDEGLKGQISCLPDPAREFFRGPVDDTNLAGDHIYYTTITPRILIFFGYMQDFHHQPTLNGG